MKKKVKRIHVILLLLIALAGIALGIGVTLLVLNLTTDTKGLSFYGLICLIIVAGLCLLLPFLTQHRDSLMESVRRSNALFGTEVSFLTEEQFMKRIGKADTPIYALHIHLYAFDALSRKVAFFGLSAGLERHENEIGLIGYREDGDFLIAAKKEGALLKALKAVEDEMHRSADIPQFTLLLGFAKESAPAHVRADHALKAALSDSEVRPSLSLEIYHEAEERLGMNVAQEEEMGRLTFDFDEYAHEGEAFALCNPNLYDALRGHVTGKDLFHRADLYHARSDLDDRCLAHILDYLKQHQGAKVGLRLGIEKMEESEFLKKLVEKLQKEEIPADAIYLMVPSASIERMQTRAWREHARGLGFHFGIYEYGGEDALALMKLKPELMTLKPENLRENAPKDELELLIGIVNNAGAKLFIEEGELGAERSYFQKPVPVEEAPVEEAPAEEPAAEQAPVEETPVEEKPVEEEAK